MNGDASDGEMISKTFLEFPSGWTVASDVPCRFGVSSTNGSRPVPSPFAMYTIPLSDLANTRVCDAMEVSERG